MKHTFRLSVHGDGYKLVRGSSTDGFDHLPLDVRGRAGGDNYLDAQRYLDEQFKTPASRWWLVITNNHEGQCPVVAYGCRLAAKDDRGRVGLTFLHALQADAETKFDSLVTTVARMLEHGRTDPGGLAGQVAEGKRDLTSFLTVMEEEYNQNKSPGAVRYRPLGGPIREITHDCGGAAALAWLTMAASHVECYPPWQIGDRWDPSKALIVTDSSARDAVGSIRLSEHLWRVVLQDEALRYVQLIASGGADVPRSPASTETGSRADELEQPVRPAEDQEHVLEAFVGQRPGDAEFCLFIDWNGTELTIFTPKSGKTHSVGIASCDGVEENPAWFEVQGYRKGRLSTSARLLLPKISLTAIQSQAIRAFADEVAEHKGTR